MKRASNTIFAVAIVAAEVASVGFATTSVYAQQSTSKKVRDQRLLLLQQQRQIEQNQRRLDAQRRELGRQGTAQTPNPGVSHGIFGDCALGFTYYLLQGCLPDHAVIIYNGGSLGGRLPRN